MQVSDLLVLARGVEAEPGALPGDDHGVLEELDQHQVGEVGQVVPVAGHHHLHQMSRICYDMSYLLV